MNCAYDEENVVVKPMKYDWIVWMMKMLLLNPWNLIELCERWKRCCQTHEIWLNCVNNENVDSKPMKFDSIVWMMKMLLLNPWTLIELCEWWKRWC